MLILRLTLLVIFAGFCFSLPAVAENSEAQARRLINALGCKACHSFEQSGSTLAPPLDQVGTRLSFQQLKQKLTKHNGQSKKTAMPSYATTLDQDLTAILSFLASLK